LASSKREAAIAAAEQTCPRCGTGRTREQDYCVDCGLRLPPLSGRVASLRRGWMRRLGWYPGDWIWVGLPTLVVAVVGAAVAIALTDDGPSSGGTTIVASSNRLPRGATLPSVAPSASLPAAPEPSAGTTGTNATATASGRNGKLTWPVTRDGWTIVLVSYPLARGRSAPLQTARRAAGLGLPEVGVLESSDFSSLHPGYAIVFSGIYSSRSDAEAALTSARATGFGTAYTREISR
jgi:hypothetical protein